MEKTQARKRALIGKGALGIFIIAALFSCGCIEPEIVEVEKIVYVDVDNYDKGYEDGWREGYREGYNEMVDLHNEFIRELNRRG